MGNNPRRRGPGKRAQIEKAYREHIPGQIRTLRQERWFKRVNPEPQFVSYEGPIIDCPECAKKFAVGKDRQGVRYIDRHMVAEHGAIL